MPGPGGRGPGQSIQTPCEEGKGPSNTQGLQSGNKKRCVFSDVPTSTGSREDVQKPEGLGAGTSAISEMVPRLPVTCALVLPLFSPKSPRLRLKLVLIPPPLFIY